jgi:hypothetical protein
MPDIAMALRAVPAALATLVLGKEDHDDRRRFSYIMPVNVLSRRLALARQRLSTLDELATDRLRGAWPPITVSPIGALE